VTSVSYDDLAAAATVGLSHRTLPLTGSFAAQLSGVPAEHVAALATGDQATALLDAAALMVCARRAGARPGPGVACPAPAAPDQAPEVPARAADLLVQALALDPVLLADLLTAATRAGYLAPAPLLPRLLDAAVKHKALRPAVAAVLGNRGRWLAGYRPDWQRVSDAVLPAGAAVLPAGAAVFPAPAASLPAGTGTGPDALAGSAGADRVWETGRRGERHAYLEALRARDPAAAAGLLAAGWSRETGDDRADLLAVLACGLSAVDEEFLEAALDDRKASVRAAGRELLARLPGSAFNRRAVERAAPLLRLERQAVRRECLVASMPEAADAAAVRDGISAQPPGSGVGARAWLLTQMIAAVPLAEWVTRFGREPDRIATLPVAGGLGPDVHAGWRRAAVRQACWPWAAAMLAAGAPGPVTERLAPAWTPDDQLAGILPPDARVARAVTLLTSGPPSAEAIAVVAACPGPWPGSLAGAVMAALSHATGSAAREYWPDHLAAAAGRHLPVAGEPGDVDYAAALERLAGHEKCLISLAEALRQAAEVIRLRRSFATQIR
jgi:hypothetical protein